MATHRARTGTGHTPPMAGVLERNIQSLLEKRREDEKLKSLEDRIAYAITRFTGSMRFVYLHLCMYGLWIVVNLGWTPLPKFDPTFVVLAMVASVEAIFLSTFVLISQNRMAQQEDRRAELDLQVSLLSEHEVTRLVEMVSAMAARMGIEASRDPELSELKQDVHPVDVMEKIDEEHRRSEEAGGK